MEGSKKRTIRFLSVFMSLIMFVCGYLAVPSEVLAAELETRANVREYSNSPYLLFIK